jgi:hypothetical protein
MLVVSATLASPQAATAQTRLYLDSVHEGTLDSSDPVLGDGTYFDRFVMPCYAGVSIRITLRSDDFDAYLSAGAPESTGWDFKDDDGAGGTDSAILLTPRTSGTCQVLATSYRRETGSYVLVASGGVEDVTVQRLEDVLRDFLARPGYPVVASEVGSLGGGSGLRFSSEFDGTLEAGESYQMVAIIEGNEPVPSTLEFSAFAIRGNEVESFLNATPDRDTEMNRMAGFQVVGVRFQAPELERGWHLNVGFSYREYSPSRRAAWVLIAR